MKFQNKLQFFFLFLALIIFTGHEFLHPFFHEHKKSHSCCYHSHKEQKGCHHSHKEQKGCHHSHKEQEIGVSTEAQHDESIKQICPICNSIASKSIQTTDVQSELISSGSLDYSQLYESFSFIPYSKPVPRGPPYV